MNFASINAPTPAASTADALLKMLRYLGMLGFLGGLAALSAMWAFGPVPDDVAGWNLLIGVMRPIFYACFFTGVVVLVVAGGISWWRHRNLLHGKRWFRVMMLMLLVAVPSLHLTARFTARQLYAAIDTGNLDNAEQLWNRLGLLYVIGFIVMLCISAIGILKPRLGSTSARVGE